ncbi:MAG: RNA polymerase sigma factor [Planctomycetes bacterium]|nr:RNA polymerase sigma factor [Planctomycetota bacterium]
MNALLDGYRRKGFAFALRMLGNADDAADAVQDGLGALWAKRAELRQDHDPTAWFFRVLRNRCIDQLRRRRVRKHDGVDPASLVDTSASDPVAAAQMGEFRERLRDELEKLEPAHREILLLRDYNDLSYAQIAEILSIAQGTVMSRLHRARMLLRKRCGAG